MNTNATNAHMPLQGKVAIVTGGSRGIGAAIVKRLAHDCAKVAFSYAASRQRADDVVRAAAPLMADGGRVVSIGTTVAFLAGPDASYITGATLNVDGGQIA